MGMLVNVGRIGSLGTVMGQGGGGGGGYTPVNAEAAALFAAMASGGNVLSDSYKAIDDALITAAKASGYWSVSDLHYFAPPTAVEDQSLYNWMAPASNKLVPTASPTYIAGQGWKSDGAAAFYDTMLAGNLANFFKQDDASMSWATWDDVQRTADVGSASSSNANGVGRTAADVMSGRLGASATKTSPNTNGQGVFCISKLSATSYRYSINGVASSVTASGSTALNASTFTILKISGAFAPNTLRVGYYRIGGHLTNQQMTDEYTAVRAAARAVDTSLLP